MAGWMEIFLQKYSFGDIERHKSNVLAKTTWNSATYSELNGQSNGIIEIYAGRTVATLFKKRREIQNFSGTLWPAARDRKQNATLFFYQS